MRKIFWVFTLTATVLGALHLFYVLATATNATQQVAGIALSLAIVVIPYIFTRCLEGMRHNDVVRVRIVGGERAAPAAERRLEDPPLAAATAPQ